MAAATACFIGAIEEHHLSPGEVGHVLLIANTLDQARIAFDYVVAFLTESPILRNEIESITQHEVRLKNRIIIGVHTLSFRSIRGRTLLAVVSDETAYLRDESSANPDVEIYRACMPALAAANGMWISISTGYMKAGLLYEKWRQHWGQPSDDVLVINGTTAQFNSTIDPAVIERARTSDVESFNSEWLGGWREDRALFLDEATVDKAIDPCRPLEIPYRAGVTYRCFVDASGGRHDNYCVCIAHRELDPERLIVDVVRGAAPPFDPLEVTQNFAKLCRDFKVYEVTGDYYGATWVSSSWGKFGIRYKRSEKNKSELYLETLPLWSRGVIRLPDHRKLIHELRLLERQTHKSGKDVVNHPREGSDDYANVTCGVLGNLGAGSTYLERITRAFCTDDNEEDKRTQADKNLDAIYAGFYARGKW